LNQGKASLRLRPGVSNTNGVPPSSLGLA